LNVRKEDMMHSTRLAGLLVAGAVLAGAADAAAQGPAPFDTGYAHINVGVQAGSHDLTQNGSFPLFDEQATFSATTEVDGGGFFEIGGGARVWRQLYAGLSFTHASDDSSAAVSGQIPDRLFFDRFHPVAGTLSGLDHSETGIHLQALWHVPITTNFDVMVGGGPTIYRAKQDLVSGITVTGDPDVVLASIDKQSVKGTGVGINLQVDGTYLFTERFGGGVVLRYAGGSVDLDSDAGKVSLDVGGFQIGFGLRVRF
jgi:hypothetical protein